MIINPLAMCDFYKVGHVKQYQKDVTQIWSNWTPRSSRIQGVNKVVHFGLQHFIKKVLLRDFNKQFFSANLDLLKWSYKSFMRQTLGDDNADFSHMERLHNLGYLPLDIYSIEEGREVPVGVPTIVLTNTHPDFYWLPNFLETVMSLYLWKPSTSATTALRYRRIFKEWADKAGEGDQSYIDWQGHDFSMRGMSGLEDAYLSGLGHLTCFNGTDTIPAIVAANKYYGAEMSCGGSIPATEHSVMCVGGQEGELETFRRLITEVYPTGIVSIVSDTWDLWKVLTKYVPALKETILNRNGRVIIRPDSGDPVNIICGTTFDSLNAQDVGVLGLLAETMGTTNQDQGLPIINNMGAVYGDSITPEKANQILGRMVGNLKLSPRNMTFGIGSFTYEYCTRDTFGFAMKATAYRNKAGEVIPIFKKPVTDSGLKFSAKGIPAVYLNSADEYIVQEMSRPEDLDLPYCQLKKVFSNGRLLSNVNFSDIRQRVRKCAK